MLVWPAGTQYFITEGNQGYIIVIEEKNVYREKTFEKWSDKSKKVLVRLKWILVKKFEMAENFWRSNEEK